MLKLIVFAILFIAYVSATIGPCGPFGYAGGRHGGDCVCAAFTQYNWDGSSGSCTNQTSGHCYTPHTSALKAGHTDQLRTTVRSMGFENEYLVIHVQYKSIPTALTNIVIKNLAGDVLISLEDFANGGNQFGATWIQYLDATENLANHCLNVAAVSIPWAGFASQVSVSSTLSAGGLFQFTIEADATIVQDQTVVVIRDVIVDASIRDSIPVTINFNYTVQTSTAITNFSLAFDINVVYWLHSAILDPLTLNLTVTVYHNISYPLSLQSFNLTVLVNGVPVPAYNYDTYYICEDEFWHKCSGSSVVVASMPVGFNCTNNLVDVYFTLNASCAGPNNNASSTLCFGVAQSLPNPHVQVAIPFTYNFCPKLISTQVFVESFTLVQNSTTILDQDYVNIHSTVNGTIFLGIDSRVNGSVLYFAKITSIKIFETVPTGVASLPYLEVIDASTIYYGFCTNPTTIEIFYTYLPDYDLITTYLQQWHNGLYFQVTIEVALTAPGVPVGKKRVQTKTFKTMAKLARRADVITAEQSVAKSASFNFNKAEIEELLAKKKDIKQQIHAESALGNGHKLALAKAKNDRMVVAAMASVGGAAVVVFVAAIVVAVIFNKKKN